MRLSKIVVNMKIIKIIFTVLLTYSLVGCYSRDEGVFDIKVPHNRLVVDARVNKPLTLKSIYFLVRNLSKKPIEFNGHYVAIIKLTDKHGTEYRLKGPYQSHPSWLNPGDYFTIEKYLPYKMDKDNISNIYTDLVY